MGRLDTHDVIDLFCQFLDYILHFSITANNFLSTITTIAILKFYCRVWRPLWRWQTLMTLISMPGNWSIISAHLRETVKLLFTWKYAFSNCVFVFQIFSTIVVVDFCLLLQGYSLLVLLIVCFSSFFLFYYLHPVSFCIWAISSCRRNSDDLLPIFSLLNLIN